MISFYESTLPHKEKSKNTQELKIEKSEINMYNNVLNIC